MITIRQAAMGDLYHINAIYNYYIKHTAITFDIEPWTMSQRLYWCQILLKDKRHSLLVAVKDDKVIGFAYNDAFKPKQAYETSTELTVYKAPECDLTGVGRALYRHLLQSIQSNGYHRAYAWVTQPNNASMRLHQKLDFYEVGKMAQVGKKHGQYHDVVLLEKKLN